MVINPVIGSGRTVERNGQLAAYKQDLMAHKDGTGFRQGADTVDMNPPLGAVGSMFYDTTVEGTLQKITNYLTLDEAFVSIGDGIHSFGHYVVGVAPTLTIEDCFTAALANPRLADGGWILLKAGTYNVTTTITLPPNVSVMGDLSGTIINAHTGLIGPVFYLSNPSVPHQIGSITYAEGANINKFFNLTFTDNLLGATYDPILGSFPFITSETGTNIEIDTCSVFGRITATPVQAATKYFVSVAQYLIPNIYPSRLTIKNCYISGVQQAVYFKPIMGVDENKFTFINNKVWCSGKIALMVSAPDTACLYFWSCNAIISNNRFKFNFFGVISNAALACYIDGTSINPVDIFIENNSLVYDSTNGINHLFEASEATNRRFITSGNSFGSSMDTKDWYIVVGDGVNSVGDINGRFALLYIQDIYYFINNATTDSQTKVILRPGEYEIDDNYNAGLGGFIFPIIGSIEGGNMPRIILSGKAGPIVPDPNANNVIFGNHLENIYFTATQTYQRLVLDLYQTNINATSIFFNKCVVKNCGFDNVGLYVQTVGVSGLAEHIINIKIDDCHFRTYSPFGGTTVASQHEIVLDSKRSLIEINNCVAERNPVGGTNYFYGAFLTNIHAFVGHGPINEPIDVVIKNCNLMCDNISYPFLGVNTAAVISLQNVRNLLIENCDISSASAAQQINSLIYIIAHAGSVADPENAVVTIRNNKITGTNNASYSDPTVGVAGIMLFGAISNVDINNNLFITCNMAASILPINTTEFVINFENNKIILDIAGYGMVSVVCANNYGTININNNELDGALQNSISTLLPVLITDLPGAPIYVSGGKCIFIENNYIKGYLSSKFALESVISTLAFNSPTIKNNTIYVTNDVDRPLYVICASPAIDINVAPPWSKSTNSICNISENNITFTDNTTANTSRGIVAQNFNFNYIVKNFINAVTVGKVEYFITAYSNPVYASKIDGVVSENIFNQILANGGALTRFGTVADDSRILCVNNKNQTATYHVNCTEFISYGFSQDVGTRGPSILLKSRVVDLVSAHATNMNKVSAQHITTSFADVGDGDYIAHADWSDLPEGLYWTNHWRNGYDAGDPKLQWGSLQDYYSGQLLIPLRLPYDVDISSVSVPIYVYNFSAIASSVTFKVSISWIFGNYSYVPATDYVTDSADFKLYTFTIAKGTAAHKTMVNAPAVPRRISPYWKYSPVADNTCPYPATYLLVAMHRMTDLNYAEGERSISVCIPYAEVKVIY